MIYRIAQNSGGVKLQRIDCYSFGKENVGEFTIANIIAALVNQEFGWEKY